MKDLLTYILVIIKSFEKIISVMYVHNRILNLRSPEYLTCLITGMILSEKLMFYVCLRSLLAEISNNLILLFEINSSL